MAGVLSFTLGLEASKFISGMGLASGQILSLAGALQGLHKVANGVWDAIEQGGALEDLSNRTGESVRNLYLLQQGFEGAGLGADAVGGMLGRLQQALSGVSERGANIGELFGSIGIDLVELRGLDAPRQFEALAAALSRMPKEEAMGFAGRLFGTEGAGRFMQLARDAKGFQEAMEQAGKSAEVVARTSAAFKALGETLREIKMNVKGAFAGIAEGAVPALQALVDFANKVDWVGIGERIGAVLNGIAKMFQSGQLGGLLMETFAAAFESLPGIAQAGLQKLGVMLLKVIQTPLTYLQAGFDYAIEQILTNPQVRKILGIATRGASEVFYQSTGLGRGGGMSFQQVLEQRQQQGLEFFMPNLGLGDLEASADGKIKEAIQRFKDSFGDIWERVINLGKSTMTARPRPPGGQESDSFGGGKAVANLSDWEKMGYVIGGGALGQEYARNTAENTRTTNILLRRLIDRTSGAAAANFANI